MWNWKYHLNLFFLLFQYFEPKLNHKVLRANLRPCASHGAKRTDEELTLYRFTRRTFNNFTAFQWLDFFQIVTK